MSNCATTETIIPTIIAVKIKAKFSTMEFLFFYKANQISTQ